MTLHHERRLDRALYHLESLKAKVSVWADEHPYRIRSNFDVNDLYKLAWLEVLDQPPADLSLIVGDCIHNLRAALDNLAFELALAYKQQPLPRGIEGKSAFPILSTDIAQDPESLKKFNNMLRGSTRAPR